MKELVNKANILVEALPYIRSFYGKTFVIKYGGSAQTEKDLKQAFAQDVVLMSFIGIRPIIVHGGGPRISATMKKMGKKPSFVDGHRVTDEETMDIVEMVLGGLVNKQIVSLINAHGGRAVGLSGKDGGLIKAKKKRIRKSASNDEDYIDIGLVGEVTEVCPDALVSLDRDGFVPVISPMGTGTKGETLNINADDIASAIAISMKAEKLIFLTDVGGIEDKKGNVLSTLRKDRAKKLITAKTITGGMLPKVKAALKAVEGGVSKTHIVDGRVPHCYWLKCNKQ
jgi:acetylglutamate kinase